MAELADASIVHFRDQAPDFGIDRKYFLFLFVLHLISNL
jgi:hypothetical protein